MHELERWCKSVASELTQFLGVETSVVNSEERFAFYIGSLNIVAVEKVGTIYAVHTVTLDETGASHNSEILETRPDEMELKQLITTVVNHLNHRKYDLKFLVVK